MGSNGSLGCCASATFVLVLRFAACGATSPNRRAEPLSKPPRAATATIGPRQLLGGAPSAGAQAAGAALANSSITTAPTPSVRDAQISSSRPCGIQRACSATMQGNVAPCSSEFVPNILVRTSPRLAEAANGNRNMIAAEPLRLVASKAAGPNVSANTAAGNAAATHSGRCRACCAGTE